MLTYILLGINISVFLVDMVLSWLGYGYHGVGSLTLWGSKNNFAIVNGQYWRFVTPLFLHGGILHLAFNSYFLYIVGRAVERSFSTARFAAIYFLSGVAGTIASFALSRFDSIGASGALFGVIGAWIPFLYRNRHVLANTREQIQRIVMVIGINLVIGLMPGIDNWAHLGGLLGGLLLGWLITPRYAPRQQFDDMLVIEDRSSTVLSGLAVLGVAILLGTLALLLILARRALLIP